MDIRADGVSHTEKDSICRLKCSLVMFSIFMDSIEKFKRRVKIYKQHKRGFELGKRAAKGYNIYLTFGSDKTITKDAKDSYRRYSMAMKHYNQVLCDKESFIQGYTQVES